MVFTFDPRLKVFESLEAKFHELRSLRSVFDWKTQLSDQFPVFFCLMGGTGTGKSTVFNSLAGRSLSHVGVLRPCTKQAVLLAHRDFAEELNDCPLIDLSNFINAKFCWHHNDELRHVILVDTPDFDSIEIANRAIADEFFILSDIVCLVTSQEKYGDSAGRKIAEQARSWGKQTIYVMNKVCADAAYENFVALTLECLPDAEFVRLGRFDPPENTIRGLREILPFSLIFISPDNSYVALRRDERKRLEAKLNSLMEDFEKTIREQAERIAVVNAQIQNILASVSADMEDRLDVIFSPALENQVKERLQSLLKKYDILYVPRMTVRNTLRRFLGIFRWFSGPARDVDSDNLNDLRFDGMQKAIAMARLKPLEAAVAQLNLRVAELLCSTKDLSDLRDIAQRSISRWSPEEIRLLYDRSFPGVEKLLEAEFERFKEGLSSADEIKLYGSYTLWALFLITVEIAVGGGFTILDALIGTAIVPFIPPWLLRLKILDLLRQIGGRIDAEHRSVLRSILEEQAALYSREFSSLIANKCPTQSTGSETF